MTQPKWAVWKKMAKDKIVIPVNEAKQNWKIYMKILKEDLEDKNENNETFK